MAAVVFDAAGFAVAAVFEAVVFAAVVDVAADELFAAAVDLAAVGFAAAALAAGFFATDSVPSAFASALAVVEVAVFLAAAGLLPYNSSADGLGFSSAFAPSVAFLAATAAPAAAAVGPAAAFFSSAAFFAARSLSYFALRSEKLSVFSSSFLPTSLIFDRASSGFLKGSSEVGSYTSVLMTLFISS